MRATECILYRSMLNTVNFCGILVKEYHSSIIYVDDC